LTPPGHPAAFAWARPWSATLLLVGVLALVRIAWHVWLSPYTLIEDEAHYWEWSRRLGWSYYSKGPGVAWVIAAATALFGDTEWAVRLPAVLSGVVSALAVAALGRSVFRDGRVGFFSALMLMCTPVHQAVSLLMTIDGPYLACWAVASLAAWHALAGAHRRARTLAWAALGAAVGAGFLFKYTILVMPVGVALFAIARRRTLRLRPGGPLLALGVAALGTIPVLIWNAGHDWATVRHLLGHVGLPGGDAPPSGGSWSYNPLWTPEFVGLQFAAAGPVLVLALLGSVNIVRTHRGDDGREPPTWSPHGAAFLICVAAPMFALYFGVTVFTNVEANWTAAGFVTLAPLAGWAAVDGQVRRDRPLRFTRDASLATLVLVSGGIAAAGALAGNDRARRAVPGLTRITGARDMAMQAHALAASDETVFMAVHYGRASLLAFYLPGRPTVYAAQALLGGRKTQYDVWHETDLTDPVTIERLLGRPGVMLGGDADRWSLGYEGVVGRGKLPAEPKADRLAFTGERFTGFPTPGD